MAHRHQTAPVAARCKPGSAAGVRASGLALSASSAPVKKALGIGRFGAPSPACGQLRRHRQSANRCATRSVGFANPNTVCRDRLHTRAGLPAPLALAVLGYRRRPARALALLLLWGFLWGFQTAPEHATPRRASPVFRGPVPLECTAPMAQPVSKIVRSSARRDPIDA
jgi:hypothetical protein